MSQIGMPSATATQIAMDAFAAWMKLVPSPLGLGVAGESNTLAIRAATGLDAIMGDGATTYGIGNSDVQGAMKSDLLDWRVMSRWDVYAGLVLRNKFNTFEQLIGNSMPKYVDASGNLVAWTFSGGGINLLDAYLTRLNATSASAPTKPTGTPTCTAATGGALASVTSGNAPRLFYTFVGLYDYWESLPSAQAPQTALTADKSAYTMGSIQTPIPAGVYKIRAYRGLPAGGAGVAYYLKDIAVTAGAAAPTVSFTEPDLALRQDISPPSFAQCLMLAEFALAYACAYASLTQAGAAKNGPLTFKTNGLLSPSNVALNLASAILGYGNPIATGILGQWNSTTFTASSVQTANSIANGLQGFLGAGNDVQARTSATLDANASLSSIGYTYVDATNPTTPQSGTIAGPLTLNLALGSTVALAIPAGRIVKTISGVTVGTATTGGIVFEGKALRTI